MPNQTAPVQPSAESTVTPAARPVTAAEGRAALRAFGDTSLMAQATVYGRGNGIGSPNTDSFWRNLPPEVAQAVLNGRYEATKTFFETWGRSIAENAREGKRVSKQAMERAQERALAAFNTTLANEGQRPRP